MQKLTLLFAILFLVSCSKESFDETIIEESPFDPVLVELESSISFRVTESDDAELLAGTAYRSTFGEVQYIIGSDGTTVECPGSSVSYDGDGEFFYISWIVTDQGPFVYGARFSTIIDGKKRSVALVGAPDCVDVYADVTYEEVDDKLVGTISGRFLYLEYIEEPLFDCKNWKDAGELTASFNVPLTICN